MFKSNLITGLIGIALLCGFLGVYIFWVPAPPLVVVMIFVLALLLFDFVRSMREIRRNSSGR